MKWPTGRRKARRFFKHRENVQRRENNQWGQMPVIWVIWRLRFRHITHTATLKLWITLTGRVWVTSSSNGFERTIGGKELGMASKGNTWVELLCNSGSQNSGNWREGE